MGGYNSRVLEKGMLENIHPGFGQGVLGGGGWGGKEKGGAGIQPVVRGGTRET